MQVREVLKCPMEHELRAIGEGLLFCFGETFVDSSYGAVHLWEAHPIGESFRWPPYAPGPANSFIENGYIGQVIARDFCLSFDAEDIAREMAQQLIREAMEAQYAGIS